jgi:hypothetical protein
MLVAHIVLLQLISQIFYLLAAPIHWCNLVSSTSVLVSYKEKEVLAAPLLIVWSLPNNLAGVSQNGNMFVSKWRANQQLSNINHHRPRHILFICPLPNTPYFSLFTTFNKNRNLINTCERIHLIYFRGKLRLNWKVTLTNWHFNYSRKVYTVYEFRPPIFLML